MTHKHKLGTEYLSAGKWPRLCTVTDFITVTNSKGETIETYYHATHKVLEQVVTDREVCAATIARGIARLAQVN